MASTKTLQSMGNNNDDGDNIFQKMEKYAKKKLPLTEAETLQSNYLKNRVSKTRDEAIKNRESYDKDELDMWEHEDPMRHALSGASMSKKIEGKAEKIPYVGKILDYTGLDKAAGVVGSNLLGLGHEIAAFPGTDADMGDIVESGKDMYNNLYGSFLGVSGKTDDELVGASLDAVRKGKLTSGYVERRTDGGKNNNYEYASGGKTLQSMSYGPGGPPDESISKRFSPKNPVGLQNWGSETEERYMEPNRDVNERGVPELSPAYGSERQDMEEAGINYGSAIKHRGLDDPNVGAAQPHLFDYQLMNKMTPRPSRSNTFNQEFIVNNLSEYDRLTTSQPKPKKRGLWDFVNSLGLGGRRRAKESGNKFFDLSGRERREARKGGYGWKNEYWKNPDADTQQFRMEDKGKRFDKEGKFSLFGNLNLFKGKGGGTTISKPMF